MFQSIDGPLSMKDTLAMFVSLAQWSFPDLHQSSHLRGSLPKSGPLDFATKNSFPLFFGGEEALVGIY